jgi:hypothetical protein
LQQEVDGGLNFKYRGGGQKDLHTQISESLTFFC